MRTVSSGTTRLLLHALAASIWQRASERGPACCRTLVQPDAWPAVLAGTGIWIIAAEQDKITGNYRTTLIAKLGAVLVPGVTAFLHARSRSTAGLAVFGAVTGASALTALFPASCWQAEPKYSHTAPRGPL